MSNTKSSALQSKPTQLGTSKKGSVEDLTRRNVELIRELEESGKQERTRSDLVAEVIANFCGSMTFVWVHVVWFGAWVVINVTPWYPASRPVPVYVSHVIRSVLEGKNTLAIMPTGAGKALC